MFLGKCLIYAPFDNIGLSFVGSKSIFATIPFAAFPKLDTKVLCNSSWSGGFRSELPAYEGAYLGLERVTLRERNAISIILKHHDTQESVYQLEKPRPLLRRND